MLKVRKFVQWIYKIDYTFPMLQVYVQDNSRVFVWQLCCIPDKHNFNGAVRLRSADSRHCGQDKNTPWYVLNML